MDAFATTVSAQAQSCGVAPPASFSHAAGPDLCLCVENPSRPTVTVGGFCSKSPGFPPAFPPRCGYGLVLVDNSGETCGPHGDKTGESFLGPAAARTGYLSPPPGGDNRGQLLLLKSPFPTRPFRGKVDWWITRGYVENSVNLFTFSILLSTLAGDTRWVSRALPPRYPQRG